MVDENRALEKGTGLLAPFSLLHVRSCFRLFMLLFLWSWCVQFRLKQTEGSCSAVLCRLLASSELM